jgi:Bacterial membrane protein YfhO
VAAVVGLAALIIAADLFRANMGFNPAIPIDHASQPVTPALRALQARAPNRFAVLSRPGIDQPLQPDLAMRYGLYDARGYDYPIERRYDAFWRATAAAEGAFIEPTQRATATPKGMRGLSLLSVSDLLQYPDTKTPPYPGLRLTYSGPDARIYRNPDALPRAFLVSGQRVVSGGDAALAAVTAPDFDARRVAVTERRLPGLPTGTSSSSEPGTARVATYGDERAEVAVRARTSSLLVLTDVYFPGWKATVDGRSADIERVDYLLRGVALPPGRHRVEFRYEPSSWRAGWILSLLGLAAALGLAAVGLSRTRSRQAGPRAAAPSGASPGAP